MPKAEILGYSPIWCLLDMKNLFSSKGIGLKFVENKLAFDLGGGSQSSFSPFRIYWLSIISESMGLGSEIAPHPIGHAMS